MYNHNKAQQSKNHVHISWDILYASLNWAIIGSDNGLSPVRRQAIIWTNDGILLIRTLRTNFSEIRNEIHSFSFKKTHFKMSSAKWRLSRLGLNELILDYSRRCADTTPPYSFVHLWSECYTVLCPLLALYWLFCSTFVILKTSISQMIVIE